MGTTKIKLLISVFVIWGFMQTGFTQTENEKLNFNKEDRKEIIKDHYKKSNILNPDTLKGDQKLVFDHFASWTLEELENIEILTLKSELAKVQITSESPSRFRKAYSFFKNRVVFHKISVKNWESFKDLAPGYKKTK